MAAASAIAQDAPAPDTAPAPTITIRATSRLVLLDVVVTDPSGRAVHSLPRTGFEILDNGKPQSIRSFDEISAPAAPPPESPVQLPPNTYTNYSPAPPAKSVNILLLDALNTPMKDQAYVRQQMVQYLKKLPPGTRIAIFTLASKLRILQGFTSDSSVLLDALNTKKALPHGSPLLDSPDQETTSDQLVDFYGSNPAGANMIAAAQQFEADSAAFQYDLRVRMTLDAVNQIAGFLSGVPGRKNLIWFSGSFPLSIVPNPAAADSYSTQRNYSEDLRQTTDLLATNQIAVYPVDARGLMASPAYSVSSNGTRAYNPAGGQKFAQDNTKFFQQTSAEHTAMQQLADATGGQAFYNTNGLKEAVTRAIDNGSNYYSIGFTPADAAYDGTFHRVQIKLSPEFAVAGYRLSYRSGYFADDPALPIHHAEAQTSAAGSVFQRAAPASSQVIFTSSVVPAPTQPAAGSPPAGQLDPRLKGPLHRYAVDYAILGKQVTFSATLDGIHHGKVEFITFAYDVDGNRLNVVSQEVVLNLPDAKYQRFITTGIPFHQEIDLPSGEVFLRMCVRDSLSNKVGAFETPLAVPRIAASTAQK